MQSALVHILEEENLGRKWRIAWGKHSLSLALDLRTVVYDDRLDWKSIGTGPGAATVPALSFGTPATHQPLKTYRMQKRAARGPIDTAD